MTIQAAGRNWSAEVSRLRQAGYSLPHNPSMARVEARKIAETVSRGSLTDLANRQMTSDMNRRRLASTRGATGGTLRTGADLQMALPKIRQPLSSLLDKGIPFNVQDPKELIELRRWCRLFYSTHDLVPLLVDIYAKFPVTGLELQCFAAETPVITTEGVREIAELAGGTHWVLTKGGKWVEAPVKSFGQQALQKVTVRRNGRDRAFYATAGHRWFVDVLTDKKKWKPTITLTQDLRPGQRLTSSYARNVVHATTPSPWRVASVEQTDRVEEVYCAVVPETESFTLDGNILTANCKDPLIEKFYTQMFLDDLNYEEFLPDQLLREYFVAGEVTALAHFNESLGIWSSEEILNPDMVAVSKSLFVEQERVQLLVKDLVENLRNGPDGRPDVEERPSERLERNYEYQMLARHYPEILAAAARDDGLDISDALVSRLVNKASPWDQRGTPPLLRSFRTLLMEESLNAAQDAVADRLYAPMVLATMGIENMGNDEPWIPSQAELDELRDDMQAALAADFKLLVHNFGVQVTSVFGRETVPRFDQDYDRIDAKLMQAWGIGQALIMGGTGAGGTYASSAINREVCEQLMMGAQKKVIRHMRKRMEIIAEAQEHYDFDLKGGVRVPLYREIVEDIVDDNGTPTGEQRIVRVPKLLIPEVRFACVVPGTPVLTPTGMKNMGDLVAGDPVIAWDEDEAQYVHDHVRSTGPRPPEPTVTVMVHSGKSVTCTRDHPFVTQRGWIAAAALKTSDLIRTSLGAMLLPMVQARHTPDSLDIAAVLGDGVEVVNNDIVRLNKGGVFCSPFPARLPATDEVWELLGHYVARGGTSRGTTVRWYTKTDEVRARIEHLITSLFGDVKISRSSGGVTVYSRPMAQWLTKLFGGELPADLSLVRLVDIPEASVFLDAVTAGESLLAHAVPAVHRVLHEMAISVGYKNDDLIPDVDIARFLGVLVGDGNYSTTHVAVESMDPEIIDFSRDFGARLGLRSTVVHQQGSRSSRVTFSRPRKGPRNNECNILHSFLRGEQMWGHTGHTKRVPPFVWSRDAEIRAAFLSGYLDTDGSVGKTTIRWTSVNRPLLDDCQVLLESLGIRSTTRTYRVFSGKLGREHDYSHLTVGHRIDRELCRQALAPLIARKTIPTVSRRSHIHVRDVMWDQVVSVTDAGEQETVALEVARNHSHVTAGLASSNTLNLRDEAQERAFVMQLKTMGVPVSDKSLAINMPVDEEQELEREALETKRKGLAKARVFKEMQDECDKEELPYPPELAAHLQATLQLRDAIAQTKMMEGQAMMASPEGQAAAALAAAGGGPPPGGIPPMGASPQGEDPGAELGAPQSTPPTASGPSGLPMTDPTGVSGEDVMVEPARNRSRPAESDEMRAGAPRRASASERWAARVNAAGRMRTEGPRKGTPRKPTRFELGPSSYGHSRQASEDQVAAAIRRREMTARHSTTPLISQLIEDPEFYRMCHAGGDESAIRADWPEIRAGRAPESARMLRDLVDQYETITGLTPIWD